MPLLSCKHFVCKTFTKRKQNVCRCLRLIIKTLANVCKFRLQVCKRFVYKVFTDYVNRLKGLIIKKIYYKTVMFRRKQY